MEPDPDVYEYRYPGTMIWGPLLLLFCLGFAGVFVYQAAYGEFTFNDHPATRSERIGSMILVSLMISPFVYIVIQGMLRHFNERIVWKDGQIVWWDSFGRERVRADEAAILSEKRVPLLVNGLIRYEIVTSNGNISFLSTMPRAAELRMRLSQFLETGSSRPIQRGESQVERTW